MNKDFIITLLLLLFILFYFFKTFERNFWILDADSFFYWNEMFLVRINFS